MKRIICLVLALIAVCVSFASCGAGGDTNMHKIMTAIHKEKAILASTYPAEADCYKSASLAEVPYHNGWDNVNYDSTEAWADNVYYKHHILFKADRVEVRENSYAKEFEIRIYWKAKENTISISLYEGYGYSVWNQKAKDPQYHGFSGDDGFSVTSYGSENDDIVFDMNVYYEKGKFDVSDATYDISAFKISNPGKIANCEGMFIEDMVDLLNDSLNGLNGIYTQKGYPIR